MDSTGRVVALAPGSATVTAAIGAVRAEASLSVTVPIVPAFPGAYGWGAEAFQACDRLNFQVLRVTNLEDSGPGSFRQALEEADNDAFSVIVFEVAGIIDLLSRIQVRSKQCLYVAGQTAPGSGITIRAVDVKAVFLQGGGTRDVAFRYLRFRNGTAQPGVNTGSHGMIIGAGENVILDHLSFSWASDQLLSIFGYSVENGWGAPRRLSVQRTLFSEPLASSPVCYATKGEVDLTGGAEVPQWYRVEEVTLHHNAAIHCSHRAPSVGSKTVQVINNVVYNWDLGAIHSGVGKPWADYVNNYFRAGPMTRLGQDYGYEISHQFRFNRPGGWSGNEPDAYVLIDPAFPTVDGRLGPSFFLSGNEGPNLAGDQWSLTSKYKHDESDGFPEVVYDDVVYGDVGLMPVALNGVPLRRDSPLAGATYEVPLQPATSAWDELVERGEVGANRRLSCAGDWVWNQDAVDARVLEEARTGTGRPSSEVLAHPYDVGGYAAVDPGEPCADGDGDGMPDAFEERYGLDPLDAGDARLDLDGDGYRNLEAYLAGMPAG